MEGQTPRTQVHSTCVYSKVLVVKVVLQVGEGGDIRHVGPLPDMCSWKG